MKKRILFIMPSMFIGGAERSLLGLLENFDYEKYDVSLFLYRHEGEFLKFIPEQVNLIPEIKKYRTFDTPIKSLLKSSLFSFGIARILSKIALKLHTISAGEKAGTWMSMQYTAKFITPLLPPIPGTYDLGIMFLGVADPMIERVQAKRKITWCHTDYDTLFPDRKMDLETYRKVDGVVAVSELCADKIKSFYPELEDKINVIENIIGQRLLLKQADEEISEIPEDKNEKVILSVGRFCFAKNFDNVPDICRRILNKGLYLRWYLIGYGGDEELIRQKIKENGMEEHVTLLGKRDNPYPYIKACDLYVQPSRYEGKCVTVREAQILYKPVVIANYDTAHDQLHDGIDGIILPQSNEELAQGIFELLSDPSKLESLANNCKEFDYSNVGELQKIYDWIEKDA